MRERVLDSGALLAFVFDEKGGERIEEILEEARAGGRVPRMAAPNWAEAWSACRRHARPDAWLAAQQRLRNLPVQVVPADRPLAEEAGNLKATRGLALADAFAAALAIRIGATLYTRDSDFRAVEREIRIAWL